MFRLCCFSVCVVVFGRCKSRKSILFCFGVKFRLVRVVVVMLFIVSGRLVVVLSVLWWWVS